MPHTRHVTTQEIAEIAEETLTKTGEDLQHIGKTINLVANVILEVVKIFNDKGLEIDDSRSRGLVEKGLAGQIVKELEAAIEVPR